MAVRIYATLVAAAVALLTAAVPGLAASVVSGVCQPTKMRFASYDVLRRTASRIYVDLPGTSVNFIQGGKANGCVIVTFSAEIYTDDGAMTVQPTLDDTAAGSLPIETDMSQFVGVTTNTATFIFPNVAPGPHSVRMHFLAVTPNGADTVDVHRSNTMVWFTSP